MKLKVAALILLLLVGCYEPAIARGGTDAALCVVSQQEATEQLEVLAFTSKTCRQCKLDKPKLAELRAEGYVVTEIDVDADPDTADRYNITHLPTYVIEKDGVEVERTHKVGVLSTLLVAMFVWIFC